MKTNLTTIKRLLLFVSCLVMVQVSKAQTPTYEVHITNETLVDPKTYEFDWRIIRTGATPLEIANISLGLGFDTTIVNGGTVTASFVAGTSEMVAAQVPASINVGAVTQFLNVGGVIYRYINVAARANPGPGSGTVVSATRNGCLSVGTRVYRIRLTNTVNWKTSSTCKHIFNTAAGSGRTNTVVTAYVAGSPVNASSASSNLGYNAPGTCITQPNGIILNGVTCTPPTFTAVVNPQSCGNLNNGSVNLTITGGDAVTGYSWTSTPPGFTASTEDITGLAPGSYTVVVTAGAGCTSTQTYTIAAGPAPSTYYTDGDGDGYGIGAGVQSCTQPAGTATQAGDCDDTNASINPGALEVCNGIDDNCAGGADDGLPSNTYYADVDGDGFGSLNSITTCATTAPSGYVSNNTDCNDNDASVNTPQTYYADGDGDGFGGAASSLLCSSTAPAGFSTLNTDCNDGNANVFPGAAEQCNSIDDNCDGLIDNGVTTSTFYQDVDGDGVGNSANTIEACAAPAGYVLTGGDCDDNNAAIQSPIGYYADADGDTYGAGAATPFCSTTAPAGYSSNNTDCNDGVAAINPGATELCNGIDDNCVGGADEDLTFVTYYADADNDGFGDPANSLSTCNGTPAGYVSNNADCNDAALLYADADGDGFGAGAPAACGVANNSDCNDADASINSPVTYYTDADGDGFGNLASPVSACSSTAPAGTVSNSADCNDAALLYTDADGDGFGFGAPVACGVANNTDCNDADASVNAPQTYYTDADGDGFGSLASPVTVCSSTAPAGTVSNSADCNDAALLYTDADGDGFGAGAPVACGVANNTDCNDADASVNAPQTYYTDADGDGFGSLASPVTVCSSTAPAGTVSNSLDCNDAAILYGDADGDGFGAGAPVACGVANNTDCNDADASVNAPQTYYADADGDGFGNASSPVVVCSSTAPVNTVSDNTDCNDGNANIFPGAAEQCNSIDDNCDGLIDNGVVTSTFYQDADGDGVGNSSVTIVACAAPAGYVLTSGDCNDNDASVQSPITYYTDADGDGFGNLASPVSACSSTAPAGTVANSADCNDAALLYTDADGDGFGAGAPVACGVANNTDCNDADASVNAPQTYYTDADGDGFGALASPVTVCSSTAPAGTVSNSADCNDAAILYGDADADGVGAGAPVACGVASNTDCNDNDGSVSAPQTYYADADGDTYGNGSVTSVVCSSVAPAGFVSVAGDCNDGDAAVNPGAAEVCANGIDDNCNTFVDEGCTGCANPATANAGADFAVCEGSSASLAGSIGGAASNGTWSTAGDGSFSPNATTLNASYTPGPLDVANGSVVLTLTTDDPDGSGDCVAASDNVTLTINGLPASTGVISGPAALCNPTNQQITYSVAAVPGASSYTWTVPAGTTIVSGQGTTTLVVSWPFSQIHNGVVGNITVTANNTNGCGSSTPSVLGISVQLQVPVTPPSISGDAKACPGDLVTYSIANVARATSYVWTVPAGASIIGSATGNVISVQFSAGFSGGTISVAGANGCGSGTARTRTVGLNILSAPTAIVGQADGVCSSTQTYSISGVTGAASYSWSVSGGASIVGPSNGLSVQVSFPAGYTTGSVSVAAVNNCGIGSARSLTVKGAPGTPGPITGTMSVCTGQSYTYDINTVTGATSYVWTSPGASTITSGQGTKIITVLYGSVPASSQIVTVKAQNGCGVSATRIFSGITISNCPRLADGTDASVSAYPNPTSDVLNVTFNADQAQNMSVRMFDATGRVVINEAKEAFAGANKIELNVKGFAPGIYSLQLQIGSRSETLRIFVGE